MLHLLTPIHLQNSFTITLTERHIIILFQYDQGVPQDLVAILLQEMPSVIPVDRIRLLQDWSVFRAQSKVLLTA